MSEELKLSVASSPHINAPHGTRDLMRDVIIALIPALCIAVYFFGPRALTVTLVSVAGSVFFEWGYRKLMHKTNTIGDLSAVITGMLLAFVLPVTVPYWVVLIGDFFGIVVVKQLYGGLGMNFLNPALAARAFLFSYPAIMSTWVLPGVDNWVSVGSTADAVTGATALSSMHQGVLPTDISLTDLFIGNAGGCLGEVSALMLILGGIYLVWRKVIRIRIPLVFIGTVAVLSFLFPQGNPRFLWMMYNILSGGLMLGAIFMATDYVTSPTNDWGEIYYAIGCGVITVVIRRFGAYPEGVSYAILIMNICAWILDKWGKPVRFGVTRETRRAERIKAKEEKIAARMNGAKGGNAQ